MTHPQVTVKLGDQEHKLMPVEHQSHEPMKLRRYDDPAFTYTDVYQYRRLKDSRKSIRLLQLRSGATDSQDIYCELTEVDYNNIFHIPMTHSGYNDFESVFAAEEFIEAGKDIAGGKIFKFFTDREFKYEALSWCWGTDAPGYLVLINERDENGRYATYKMRIKKQLALALRHLRYLDRTRTLWIDAICINQDDPSERSHQVHLMSEIYTRAKQVCVWLGDSDDASKLAIPFVRDEMMDLQKFETLFSDRRYAEKWKALVILMQREWFSRRWVVQEIALANKATIHCGEDSVGWSQFAAAVELFVEVESATHLLADIMQLGVELKNVPGWFEHISSLDATLLVQATGQIFRARRSPLEEIEPAQSGEENLGNLLERRMRVYRTIDLLDRRSLLSLEYLVSTFYHFGTSEPRDAVYSMLGLSRDATPLARSLSMSSNGHDDPALLILRTCEPFLEEKAFPVDYRRPYTEFCKDFVSFAIEQRMKSDPSQALDVLCRPWALPPRPGKSDRLKGAPKVDKRCRLLPRRDPRERPWIVRSFDLNHEAVEEVDLRSMKEYWADVPDPDDRWTILQKRHFPRRQSQGYETEMQHDMSLPSWVSQVSRAPTGLYFGPGIGPRIPGRANSDPLVGQPKDGHKNYSAAQERAPKLLQFRRRPWLGHHSLFVNGLVVDEVEEVMAASQGGNIPSSWFDLAGWHDLQQDPPSAFLSTLVAGRGRDNRNPPHYYALACRISAARRGAASGGIDTAGLDNNEQNPIVAEFGRRVYAVIWNKHLFKTKNGRLGLGFDVEKGDKLCILYGCTVPVVLHEHSKTLRDLAHEKEEDTIMALRRRVQKMEMLRQQKADYIARNLLQEELENNRQDLRQDIQMINTLERKQSTYREHISKAEDDNHDRDYESLAKEKPPDESEDSEEDQFSDALEHQPQMRLSGDRNEAHANEMLGGEAIRLRRCRTEYEMRQEAAQEHDRLCWYTLRGDCYLHGMMDGEAIREQYEQGLPERKFELR